MRSVIVMLVLCLTIIGASMTNSPRLPHQEPQQEPQQDKDPGYAAAYEKWSRAIDSHPELGEPFWRRDDIGPPELRSAVRELRSFGPNITPFVVEKLRKETDRLRVYRLMFLLDLVSGINLYFDSGTEQFYEAAPQFRNRFIEDWDSQKFVNATELLRNSWRSNQENTPGRIDPKRLTRVRRFGVFAIPFIIESIERQNSPELFAAFLIITGQSNPYTEYLEDPSKQFAARDQKLSLINSWVSDNESKLDKLSGLNEKIKAMASR